MRSRSSRLPRNIIAAALAGIGLLATAAFHSETSVGSQIFALAGSDCRIKGNISQNTGEKIYHVPGQEHYNATRASRKYGERWFCSGQDARQAGWRRARR